MFKKLIRAIKRLFTKSDRTDAPVVSETRVLGNTTPIHYDKTIGLVVGHNEGKQGANNYLKESEWVFHSRITRKLQAKLSTIGIRSVIVFRPSGTSYSRETRSVANRLEDLKCTHAICFHFNSAGESARGCEVLVAETRTEEDDKFADVFTDILNERYGFVERHKDGMKVVNSKHNGYGMINRINGKGIVACLVEPCFAGYKTKESAVIFEQEDAYVDVLVDSILGAWK